jgi:hypothetical protein
VRATIKMTLYVTALAALAYVTFLVPLGERTLYEHVVRISRTDEAQDLGREVQNATDRAETELRDRIARAHASDGGTATATP